MAGPRYIADAPEAIRSVELDGLTAVFHIPSCTTHILAAPAPQILQVLGQRAATAATILARLKTRFDLEKGRGALASIEARLGELENAGLVRRA